MKEKAGYVTFYCANICQIMILRARMYSHTELSSHSTNFEILTSFGTSLLFGMVFRQNCLNKVTHYWH